MQKAIVIGCPGAGKSTFARALRDTEGLPLYYLDMLWHRPDRTNISAAEFDAGLKEIVKKKQWIIDGNYQRTLEMRLQECDTVFLLDYPLEVCLLGAESRIGKSREDLPWMETELDEEFRQWILHFPQNELPAVYQLIGRYQGEKRVHIFHSRADVRSWLEKTFGPAASGFPGSCR